MSGAASTSSPASRRGRTPRSAAARPRGAPETALYSPVKLFLEGKGFAVAAEVNGADVVGRRGDELVVVELKRTFGLELVLQGVERQSAAPDVYLAVAEPGGRVRRSPRWRGAIRLCRLLGLGLLTVRAGPGEAREPGPSAVTVELEPAPYRPRRSARKRAALLRELDGRTGDHNVGGSSRRPIVTAYREESLRIARRLGATGTAAVRALRAEAPSPRAGAILERNVYGWFARVARGIYRLTPAGEDALRVFADLGSSAVQ